MLCVCWMPLILGPSAITWILELSFLFAFRAVVSLVTIYISSYRKALMDLAVYFDIWRLSNFSMKWQKKRNLPFHSLRPEDGRIQEVKELIKMAPLLIFIKKIKMFSAHFHKYRAIRKIHTSIVVDYNFSLWYVLFFHFISLLLTMVCTLKKWLWTK